MGVAFRELWNKSSEMEIVKGGIFPFEKFPVGTTVPHLGQICPEGFPVVIVNHLAFHW